MNDLRNFIPETDFLEVALETSKGKLTNPDGTPMTITMYAPYSKQFKENQYAIVDEAIKNGLDNSSAKDLSERTVKTIAKNISSWNITLDGKKPKLTYVKAKEVIETVPFVQPLLEKALGNSEGFM